MKYHTILSFLAFASVSILHGIVVENYTSEVNDRFYDGPGKAFLAEGNATEIWSGVARGGNVSLNGGQYAAMVTSKHFVSSWHYHPPVGTTVTFHRGNYPASESVTRTVSSIQLIGTSAGDVALGTLDSDCPAWVNTYRVLDHGVSLDPRHELPAYVFGWNTSGTPPFTQRVALARCFLGQGATTAEPQSSMITDHVLLAALDPVVDNSLLSFQGGDSSGPSFTMVNGEPVLIGVNHFAFGGASKVGFVSELIADALPSGYQAQFELYNAPRWRPMETVASGADWRIEFQGLAGEKFSSVSSSDPNVLSPFPTSSGVFHAKFWRSGVDVKVERHKPSRITTELRFIDEDTGATGTFATSTVGSVQVTTGTLPWVDGHRYSLESRYNAGGVTGAWIREESFSIAANGMVSVFIENDPSKRFFRPIVFQENEIPWHFELQGTATLVAEAAPAPGTPTETYLSNPLLGEALFRGAVGGVSGDVISFGPDYACSKVLAVDEFNAGSAPYVTHIAECQSSDPNRNGRLSYVSDTLAGSSGNAGSIVVSDGSLFAGQGDVVVVRPIPTLGAIFGDMNDAGLYMDPGYDPTLSDNVMLFDVGTQAMTVYAPVDAPGVGYPMGIYDIVNYENGANDSVGIHGAAIVRRVVTSDLVWSVAGHAKRSPNFVKIYPDYQLMGSPQGACPTPVPLSGLNMPIDVPSPYGEWGLQSGTAFLNADQIYTGSNGSDEIFYRTNAGPVGWYKSDGVTSADNLEIGPGTGLFIRQWHFSSIYPFEWVTPAW